ncbi:Rv1733c family protein [Actinoplanes sp. CA-142083]|uniref:Rv1733c family protein n=1 Tax=Actinoplanes sp. CA-142083 TaxID=3239903 RepID=UPI003D8CEB6A
MRRLLRRLGWDRNPLRRRSDRVEAWLNAVLLVVLLIAGGMSSVAAGRSAYREQARAAAWERAHRFEVWAVLQQKPVQGTATARWKAPDGSPRTGPIAARATAAAGTWKAIWVDERGAVVAPPPRRRPATSAAEPAVVAVLLVAAALALLRLLFIRLLDRRRMRSWDVALAEVTQK